VLEAAVARIWQNQELEVRRRVLCPEALDDRCFIIIVLWRVGILLGLEQIFEKHHSIYLFLFDTTVWPARWTNQ
jgi:hypothetical protein